MVIFLFLSSDVNTVLIIETEKWYCNFINLQFLLNVTSDTNNVKCVDICVTSFSYITEMQYYGYSI
jgi:hypothetical protein